MEDKNLEKTKPIKVLKDIEENEKELEEKHEEELAEKNINEAEKILEEEKGKKKKEKPLVRFKKWWSTLDKKHKILYGILGGLFLILLIMIIVLIVYLIVRNNKVENENPEDTNPVLFDNYYYKNGSLYFLDSNGSEIGSYECTNKNEKLCYVAVNSYQDGMDITKSIDIDGNAKTEHVPIYNNNYVFIFDNEKETDKGLFLYSITNSNKVDDTIYNDIKAYSDNYLIISNTEDKYGLYKVDENLTEIITPEYTFLTMKSDEDKLIALEDNGYVVINQKNETQSKAITQNAEIKNYNNYFVVTKEKGLYKIYKYSTSKNEVLESDREFIDIQNEYYFYVENKELKVKDKDELKYNEDNIELVNTSYVKTLVYDSDNRLTETRISFSTEIKEDSIVIGVYDDNYEEPQYTNLSLYDAKINENYNYVNYFAGSLYFYRDEEKDELIGSYPCNNKNETTSTKSKYNNCFIASDTVFEDNDMMNEGDEKRSALTPLINNRFVFIEDGENTIILYDIVSETTKSTYTSVNTYTESTNNFTSISGSAYVTALNKKGKYGVIKIDGSSVTPQYVFNYNKIEKLGNYFIALDTTNNWVFLSGNINGSFTGKIMGYTSDLKYVKTKESNKYSVYTANGDKVGNDTYLYVELYSDFYAGVDSSRKLYVYDYEGNKLSSDSVTVGNYSFTRTSKPAFKVSKNGSNYNVSVYNGKSYDTYTLNKITETTEQTTTEETTDTTKTCSEGYTYNSETKECEADA